MWYKARLVFVIFCLGQSFIGFCEKSKASLEPLPTLTCHNIANVLALKKQVKDGHYADLILELSNKADALLNAGPYSVINKTTTPPSGDKRDYYSIGPYWWPDPTKEDGLPWINRDGEVNPMNRGEHVDYEHKNEFLDALETLTWAFYFTENKKYAKKLTTLLNTWFVDSKTRMNPNLNYAQGIPGRNTGRGIGIIEWTGISKAITAIEVLEIEKQLFEDEGIKLRYWFIEFRDWIEYSDYGQDERAKKNNHGTWYDYIYVSLSIFLDQEDEAREYLKSVTKKRIDSQIDSAGKQSHELKRTKAMSYSTMNLIAFLKLCEFGERLGEDLWNYESVSGGSIPKALGFLEPYTSDSQVWPYKQIVSLPNARKKLKALLISANQDFGYPTLLMVNEQPKPMSIIELIK